MDFEKVARACGVVGIIRLGDPSVHVVDERERGSVDRDVGCKEMAFADAPSENNLHIVSVAGKADRVPGHGNVVATNGRRLDENNMDARAIGIATTRGGRGIVHDRAGRRVPSSYVP